MSLRFIENKCIAILSLYSPTRLGAAYLVVEAESAGSSSCRSELFKRGT